MTLSSPTYSTDAAKVGVIETDSFCEKCGFNLHSQHVSRDPNLGILVCRCPECGTHQPAGQKTTAGTAWISRLATFLLMIWVMFVAVFVTASGGLMMGMQAGASELLTTHSSETRDGRRVIQNFKTRQIIWNLEGDESVTIPNTEVVYVYRIRPWITRWRNSDIENQIWTLIMVVLSALAIVGVASFLASISWHWRRGRMYFWLILPVLVWGFVALLIWGDTRKYSGAGVYQQAILTDVNVQQKLAFAIMLLQAGSWP